MDWSENLHIISGSAEAGAGSRWGGMGWGGEEDTHGEALFSSLLTLPIVLRLVTRHEYVQTCRILSLA